MTSTREASDVLPPDTRRLSIVVWVVLVVVYLAVIQGATRLFTAGMATSSYAAPTSTEEVLRGYLAPIGLSALFVAAVVTYLRWWGPAMVEHKRVEGWVVVVPIIMVVGILAQTDYAGLASKGGLFVLGLLAAMLCVGFAEEMMFRGIGLTALRAHGFTEGRAALWSTVVFGLAHAVNLFTEGPGAFLQVLTTIVAGYFFYLIRRRAGTLLVPMLVHGLWDFSLISNAVATGTPRALGGLGLLIMVVLAIVVLVRRRQIEPSPQSA